MVKSCILGLSLSLSLMTAASGQNVRKNKKLNNERNF
jgi:hypothetical protein